MQVGSTSKMAGSAARRRSPERHVDAGRISEPRAQHVNVRSVGGPLVSVIIPVYNGAKTLARALRSIVAQDLPDIEVVVVDDGGTDNIAPIIASFPDLRFRVARLARRQGASVARNHAIALASGQFVAFLDADDEWLPGKLKRQIELLQNDDATVLSCTDVLLSGRGPSQLYSEVIGAHAHGEHAWKALLKNACVVTSSVVTRRSALAAVGGFDPNLVIGEDQDLWIRLSLHGNVHHDVIPLTRKYQSSNGLSHTHRHLVATIALPMIEEHVASLSDRLSSRERREILARRRLVAGRNSYESGDILRGARLILAAVLRGERPIENLAYLITSSPAGKRLRRMVGWQPSA